MIKPARLFLIRHAPIKQIKGFFPQNNPNAIINDNQIKKLATSIPKNCFWYVSPLKRAVQTAKALSKYVSYSKIIYENKLMEQNYGDWSGKKVSDIWKIVKNNKIKHNYSFIAPNVCPPMGESFLDQSKRVKSWLQKLKLSEGQTIVIISHAGTIKSILSHALQIKPDYAVNIEILHQSINILEMINENENKFKGGRFRLLALNK